MLSVLHSTLSGLHGPARVNLGDPRHSVTGHGTLEVVRIPSGNGLFHAGGRFSPTGSPEHSWRRDDPDSGDSHERFVTSRQRHRLQLNQDDDFWLRNLSAILQTQEESSRVMTYLRTAIASVSLLGGVASAS